MKPALLLRTALAAACCTGTCALAMNVKPAAWNFDVLLDGKPIGKHQFTLQPDASTGGLLLVSQAQYDVKFLGLSFYKYTHKATEKWQQGCLHQLDSDTTDDGKPTRVQATRQGADLAVTVSQNGPAKTERLRGCVMSFAYWNPDIRQQTQLINPQTGLLERVSFQANGRVPFSTVGTSGKPTEAQQWTLQTPTGPILLWYGPAGEWLGLEATVAGQRKLQYKLP
jgi:hypothetical protein